MDEKKSREELLAELERMREALARLTRLSRSARRSESRLGLIEERDQLIGLIENSSEAISIATPEGVYSYMNPAGLQMVGLESVEDVAGLSIGDLHPEHMQEVLRKKILPAVRSGRWQGELVYRNLANGTLIPCWTNAFAVRHSRTGELIGLAALAHDVSAIKRGELHRERLIALNDVSRRVATSLLEQDDLHRAIGIILEGVGRILDVDRSFLCRFREDRRWIYRTHQWSRAEARVEQLQPAPEPSEPFAWATAPLERGETVRVPDVVASDLTPVEGSAFLRPDVGSILAIPVLVRGRLESFFGFAHTDEPRGWEEEEVSTLQIIVDSFARAVERRIVERERRRIARDLERAVARERQASRYKSEFLASMSHELRTPMNAIVAYAELLGRSRVDPRKQAVWISNIRRSTEHLLSLVNDVLDLSKIEAGEMSVQRSRCSLPELIAEVEGLLRGNAEEKLIGFDVVYERPVPEAIDTDPVRFKQILINLVGNAIKFTKRGGVTIRVDMRSPESGPSQLLIAVEDTGIGIEERELERLFRPFYQAHSLDVPRAQGTGLGLDISRHLVRLLGGEIGVESEVGVGSTFTLRLDLDPEATARLATPAPGAVHEEHGTAADERCLQGKRILIVDDNADNREVLRFLIAEAEGTCDSAEDGAQGVQLAIEAQQRGRPYDVILMDMNMPVLDGYLATAELVGKGIGSPVIALTALATTEDEERCREAGCVAYVSKPVVPSAFLETVARHVRSEQPPAAPRDEKPTFTLVGNPRFEPLIRRYVESFPGAIEALRASRREGRMDDVRTRVHRLRGTATNYGFPEISEVAGRCEDAIRGDEPRDLVDRELEHLLGLMERTHRAG